MKFSGVFSHRLTEISRVCAMAGMWLLLICAQAQPTTIYSTGFEPSEGFDDRFALVGQGAWVGTDSNGNGIVTNFFAAQGQQAYVGFFPLTNTGGTLSVWRPLNFDPVAAGKPVVKFSVAMAIFDSTNAVYDYFRWSVYNADPNPVRLFSIEFDNSTLDINYALEDGEIASAGRSFTNDVGFALEVTMDFASNLWSATLDGAGLVSSKPIRTTGAALTLGDIDAVWIYGSPTNAPGNNFMVFDDYEVTAEAAPARPFQLGTLGLLPNGSFLLRLTGEQGRNYAIEASTNLLSWTSIKTNNATDGTFDFVDSSATGLPRRFYRARFVP
jgi:hypothetical protein